MCVCVSRKSNNTHTLRCLACKFCLLWFRLNRLLISAYAAGSAAPPTSRKKCDILNVRLIHLHTHRYTYICRQAERQAGGTCFGIWWLV